MAFAAPLALPRRRTLCTLAPTPRCSAAAPESQSTTLQQPPTETLPSTGKSQVSKFTGTETVIPTPVHGRIPVLGYIFDVFIRKVNNIQLAQRYGPVYKTDLLGYPITSINDLDAITECYKDSLTFRSTGAYPPTFVKIFGENCVVFIDGPPHAAKRNSVLPAFSPQFFPLYFETIADAANAVWDRVHRETQEGKPVTLTPIMKDHFFRLFLRVTSNGDYLVDTGISAEDQYEKMRDLFIKVSRGFVSAPLSPAFRAAVKAREELLEQLSALICQRLATRASTIESLRSLGSENIVVAAKSEVRAGKLDLLTILCASSSLGAGPGVKHDHAELLDLAEQVLVLWNAGYSTQSSATLCCIFEALRDKNVLTRLRDEQTALAATYGDLTIDQVTKKMPLLDSYLNEVLRVYPPLPAFLRKVDDDVLVMGHKIEKGTVVAFDVLSAMRNPDYYPDPHELQIDRFMPKRGKPQPAPISSFGVVGGAHFCIGAALARVTMKATLAAFLRNYDLTLDPDQTMEYLSAPEVLPSSGIVISKCKHFQKPGSRIDIRSISRGSEPGREP